MKSSHKEPLNLDLYQDYSIDHKYCAFLITFKNLSQDEIDEIENEYQIKGHKIFHTEMNTNKDGTFDYKIIVAKLEFTF